MPELSNEQTYPGVELVYPLAVSSYDVALRRLDAVDGRLQTIMGFIVATSAAVPALAAQRGAHFRSYYFYGALTCFILAIVVGTLARLYGQVRGVRPRLAFNHWLHKPDWEFKMDFINQAADDFDYNITKVTRKWQCSIAITALFFAQTVLMVAWVVWGSS